MEIYSGKLVIELATIVEPSEENIMKNKAHEGLSSELTKELRLILGDAGYMAGAIGTTLEKVEDAKQYQFSMIMSQVEKSKKEINHVYNKASRTTCRIE
jgi:hypothetical protein